MTAPDYIRPNTLKGALDALAGGDMRVAAGCTDLFPATSRKILPGPVLDITGISTLSGISSDDTGITIGAATTWSSILRADLPAAFDGLKQAARQVGATQIQNRGTIAGNICNASPAADGVPPLLTLDAEVILQSATGQRQVPLQSFITGPRRIDLRDGELVTAIHAPTTATEGQSHFLKLGARAYLVISIAMTAVRITVHNGLVTSAAVAVGACGPVATRIGAVERALIGGPLDPVVITDDMLADALSPIDDVRADAAYRLSSAGELLRRTLREMKPL